VIAAATCWTEDMLDTLQVDHRGDHNIRNTPRRVACIFVGETIARRFAASFAVTVFSNACSLKRMIASKLIAKRSPSNADLWPCV